MKTEMLSSGTDQDYPKYIRLIAENASERQYLTFIQSDGLRTAAFGDGTLTMAISEKKTPTNSNVEILRALVEDKKVRINIKLAKVVDIIEDISEEIAFI